MKHSHVSQKWNNGGNKINCSLDNNKIESKLSISVRKHWKNIFKKILKNIIDI